MFAQGSQLDAISGLIRQLCKPMVGESRPIDPPAVERVARAGAEVSQYFTSATEHQKLTRQYHGLANRLTPYSFEMFLFSVCNFFPSKGGLPLRAQQALGEFLWNFMHNVK